MFIVPYLLEHNARPTPLIFEWKLV